MKRKTDFKNEVILSLIIISVALISFVTIRSFITSGELEIEPFSLVVYGIFNYYFAIFLHEFGHLLFGILTGYQFISFRIGSLVIYKDEHIKLGVEQIYGSAAHVVLKPPKLDKRNRYPSYFYHAGGFMVNWSVVIVAILFLNSINTMHKFLFSFFITLLVINLLIVLTNGIPFKMNGIPNDGYNLIHMYRDRDSYYGLYVSMSIHAALHEGALLEDLEHKNFALLENADISKHYVVNALLFYYDSLLAKQNFLFAYELLESFELYLDNYDYITSTRIKKELSWLRLFLEIDGKSYFDDLDILDDLQHSKSSITNQRILFTQEFLIKKNFDQALVHKQRAIELAQIHPLKTLAETELSLIDYIEFYG